MIAPKVSRFELLEQTDVVAGLGACDPPKGAWWKLQQALVALKQIQDVMVKEGKLRP